ncbi:MAG: SurA N-terminal domain-containing protein [Candidatus Pacearchaeota archaeon]
MEKGKGKNEVKISKKAVLISVIAIVIIAAGIFYFTGNTTQISQGEVVATVNGEEIRSGEVEQTQQSSASQGQQLSEEEATEQLINQKLLVQEAESKGYSVSTEDVEQRIEAQASQQGQTLEDVKNEIESQGFSYDELIESQKENLMLQNYLQDAMENQVESVPEEELKEFYNQNKEMLTQGAQGQEAPEFEEVKEQLEMFLQQEQQQQVIGSIIQELRANADIVYEAEDAGEQTQPEETEIDSEDIEIIE